MSAQPPRTSAFSKHVLDVRCYTYHTRDSNLIEAQWSRTSARFEFGDNTGFRVNIWSTQARPSSKRLTLQFRYDQLWHES